MTKKLAPGISINILDKDYLIACEDDERHDLQRSADYLDKKMREIRASGKIIGSDRIAVIAALNITHELLSQDGGRSKPDPAVGTQIRNIQEKIEEALDRSRQIEL